MLIARIAAFIARRRRQAAVFTELNACSDRELDDIGLTRFDIARVARTVS